MSLAHEYISDVLLGETYTDTLTGFSGVATTLNIDINSEQRVLLERLAPDGSDIKSVWIDVSRLEHAPR